MLNNKQQQFCNNRSASNKRNKDAKLTPIPTAKNNKWCISNSAASNSSTTAATTKTITTSQR